MYYVIIMGEKDRCYGPFVDRKAAYAFVAEHGGVSQCAVLSDRAMQQNHQHRTIVQC